MIMKKVLFLIMALVSLSSVKAESPVTVGVDLYSRYVWRGTDFGNSPSIQPTLKYTNGGFSAGVWGAYSTIGTYKETDLFVSYTLPFGLTIGATDFFMPTGGTGDNLDYFNYTDTTTSHVFEVNAAYAFKGFTFTGSYCINESNPNSSISMGGDTYVEAKYTLESGVNFFAGAGNGWYTSDTEFALCNVGVGATKTIKVTDSFSIPVNGSFIVNPEKKDVHFVVGLSF